MALARKEKKLWLCPRCGNRWEKRFTKCQDTGCTGKKRKPRVPKHAVTLRDHDYEHYVSVNQTIHWVGDECAVCGRERSQDRKLDRDHDHSTGQPRGLCCVGCNILMPRGLTAARARQIAAYLARVEAHYAEDKAA